MFDQVEVYLPSGNPKPRIPLAPSETMGLVVLLTETKGCRDTVIPAILAVSVPIGPDAEVPVFESP
jgi:hypothetical protein